MGLLLHALFGDKVRQDKDKKIYYLENMQHAWSPEWFQFGIDRKIK
jgi:hypothetical protein